MKLSRITFNGERVLARLEAEHFVLLPYRELHDLLAQENWPSLASAEGARIARGEASVELLFNPAHTFCIGLNYKGHIKETGKPTPEYPTIFAKYSSTLTGPTAEICLGENSQEVDWEVELGVVIGKSAKNISRKDALDYVAGYTVVNDISMRDWQSRTNQWFQGKNFEATTPVGPYLVTPDEVDHARDLRITCAVDAEIVQEGRTSDLLFGVAELISYISQFTTLLPGDLIATGTPSGVGMARTPKRFLKPGQVLTSTIEGLGTLQNRIVL